MTYEEQLATQKAEGKAKLLSLIEPLKAAEVAFVVAYFDGSGDSGQIDAINYYPNSLDDDAREEIRNSREGWAVGQGIDAPTLPMSKDQIDAAFWNVMPSGYENNAGGFGAVVFNVNAGTVKVNYSYRVEETNEDDYEV